MPLNSQFVHERLQAAAKKLRWSQGARHLISGLAGSLFFLALFLMGDTQFHFGAAGRWLGFLLTVLPLAAGGVLALPALLMRVTDASIARRIEQACAGSRNVLINAVQFDRALAADSPLRPALFNEMHDPFPQVRWADVFDLVLLKRLALALAGIALGLSAWGMIRPAHFANSAARIFLPAGNIAPLTRTQILSLTPGDATVAHGGEIKLAAKLGGSVPDSAWVHFREAGSSWQKALMDRDTGQPDFNFAWQEIRAPIEYYVEAGDARSDTHRINVRPRTAIRARSAQITPPAYTRLAKYRLKDFAMLQNIVPGSRVAISLEFNSAASNLRAGTDGTTPLAAAKVDATHWNLDGKITGSQTLKIEYNDDAGQADSDSLQIAVKPDDPPKINITDPPEGREITATPDTSLPLQFLASDNFALGSVAIYKSTNDKPDAELVHEWKEAVGRKTFAGELKIPLRQFITKDDNQVTFCVVAKDQNDVSGPGVTFSRPVVVTIRSPDKLQEQSSEAGAQLHHNLDELIKLQQTNLDETRAAAQQSGSTAAVLAPLLDRQMKIADIGSQIVESAEAIAPEIRSNLRTLGDREMKDAVLALRNGSSAAPDLRAPFVATACVLEAAILARLQGAPADADAEAAKGQIQDLIAGVEELLQKQRELLRETGMAADQAAVPLSDRQDALAEQSQRVRKEVDKSAQNAAMGDQDFRARLVKVSAMFGEFKVYEQMLAAADKLQTKKFADAGVLEKGVVVNLAKIIDYLNQWQVAQAGQKAEALQKQAADMKEKLDKLAAIQREIIEKSKELAHKDQFRPEDLATAKEIKKEKDLMAQMVEQMLTDAHIFPDLKPSNELRSELTQIYEDVIQSDKQDVAEGKLTPQEIAVQKEDGILQEIEKAKKIAEDMEMWLPNKAETQQWLLENFDKTEMPDIPNLPLPDAFEDVVGKLLDDQQSISDQVQDAASNQAFAQNGANGWEIRDGPMPGFGAQGKSGNERPNRNEQTGRSSGGREGMSNGEMVGDRASNLEGSTPNARRTNDPMQQGHVKDDGGIGKTRATGGGKAGGFSDRNGMDGNAPLRGTNAPSMTAGDAIAVEQALLAEKTSKKYAQASLLYLKTGGMADVARLMDESQLALKEGRVKDFQALHQKIVARLNEVRGEIQSGATLSMPGNSGARTSEKQLTGGDEGQAPDRYKKQVADYYRSLNEETK
jgi:hypothetical protein